ncbi:DE-cadherin-like [Scyliorhinus canicula]|uniref:DE-cadherin-like n=1 Tax=Scyliorhinus canicula TaxID=7830 RepID=UPI0018F5C3E4|nr:DE-cadherin-like [Scyliorhinus canicula]
MLVKKGVQEKKAKIIFDVDPALLLENQPIGTVVAVAKDDTIDVNDPEISLTLDAVDGFDINSHSGHITTTKVFDFELETMDTYFLQIELSTSNYSDTKFLKVIIQNVNEPPKCDDPDFVAGTVSVDVAENIDKSTSIYHIHAEDEDIGDILKYKIESKNSFPTGCGNVFSIDQRSGVLFVNSTLDYDAGYHKCRLGIQVEDQHNLFCQGTLVVNVRDLNDEPPVFKKDLNDTVHVLESEPVGKIIAKVEALDRDENDTVIYRFAKTEDTFALGENSGDITLVKPLDYDNTDLWKVYLLPILAFDNDLKHTATHTLTVSVDNVNEAPICDPAFTQGAGEYFLYCEFQQNQN